MAKNGSRWKSNMVLKKNIGFAELDANLILRFLVFYGLCEMTDQVLVTNDSICVNYIRIHMITIVVFKRNFGRPGNLTMKRPMDVLPKDDRCIRVLNSNPTHTIPSHTNVLSDERTRKEIKIWKRRKPSIFKKRWKKKPFKKVRVCNLKNMFLQQPKFW